MTAEFWKIIKPEAEQETQHLSVQMMQTKFTVMTARIFLSEARATIYSMAVPMMIHISSTLETDRIQSTKKVTEMMTRLYSAKA